MRVSGVPFKPGRFPAGPLTPTAVVVHRTYGLRGRDTFSGAESIGINGRDGQPIGFHFLVGKNPGQATQFYDTTTRCWHARGASNWAIGIEFDGVNEDVLTPWQVSTAAVIFAAISDAHGIPLTYYTGPRQRVAGFLPHASAPDNDHMDMLTRPDWDRIMAATKRPACACPPETITPPTAVDWAAVKRMAAAEVLGMGLGTLPTLYRGQRSLFVVVAQKALNVVTGRGLKEDGDYGAATEQAVRDFQHFMGIPINGTVDDVTRWWLTVAAQNIRDGRA